MQLFIAVSRALCQQNTMSAGNAQFQAFRDAPGALDEMIRRHRRTDVIPTFLRLITGSPPRVPNQMLATKGEGCARCGT